MVKKEPKKQPVFARAEIWIIGSSLKYRTIESYQTLKKRLLDSASFFEVTLEDKVKRILNKQRIEQVLPL